MEPSPVFFGLLSRIYQAAGTQQLANVLEEIDQLASHGDLSAGNSFAAKLRAFVRLRELTIDNYTAGQQFINGQLAPLCMLEEGNIPNDAHGWMHNLRQQLALWIDQYPEAQHVALRSDVLAVLEQELQRPDPSGVCATVAALGYRRETIVRALWDLVANRDSEIGDIALSTLAFLSSATSEYERLLSALHARLVQRCSLPIIGALSRLADPRSVPVVTRLWLDRDSDSEYVQALPLAVRILTAVADRHDSDSELQVRIWSTIMALMEKYPNVLRGDLYLAGDVTPLCNNQHVVSTLLSWLTNDAGRSGGALYRRYLLLHRLQACIRPSQLLEWRDINDDVALAQLRQDVLDNTGTPGSAQTQEILLKEAALDIWLHVGSDTAMSPLEDAVAGEDNHFVRQTILEYLACFRLDSLPPAVITWIGERPEPNEEDPSGFLAYRLAATEVARSAASHQAYDALSRFGLTTRGETLQKSVEALADVTRHLVGQGDISIIERTVDDVLGDVEPWQQTAAAYTLASLAEARLIPHETAASVLSRLMTLITDEGRSAYERSLLLVAMTALQSGEFASEFWGVLHDWAIKREDWLGWRALEMLARYDHLHDLTGPLHLRLGLELKDGTFRYVPTTAASSWAAMLVGTLYRYHPQIFVSAIASMIEHSDSVTVAQILPQLLLAHRQNDNPVPAVLINGLLQRALRHQTPIAAETDLFASLAALAPDVFGKYEWERAWANWIPDSRVTLAHALGGASYTDLSARSGAINHLAILIGDSQYAVRRAAYQGLSKLAPDLLQHLCSDWSYVQAIEARQRAAEASVWLAEGADHDASSIFGRLGSDEEPHVRDAAMRCRMERRRRTWAANYLATVLAVATASDTNAAVRRAWPYAQALIQVGNDECLDELREQLTTRVLPAHVRHWLRHVLSGLEDQWQSTTRAWPQPWLPWKGIIQEGQGEAILLTGRVFPIWYSLWQHPATEMGDRQTWGGAAWTLPFGLADARFTLRLHDGNVAEVVLTGNENGLALFVGRGPLPRQAEVR